MPTAQNADSLKMTSGRLNTHHLEARASWIEDANADDALPIVSGRIRAGHVVDRDDSTMTLDYGSSAKFRFWGFLMPRQFPLLVSVSVQPSDGDKAEIEVTGRDGMGRYLVDLPVRRGERTLCERLFEKQFAWVFAELRGSRAREDLVEA
jgi:hypothetical protein